MKKLQLTSVLVLMLLASCIKVPLKRALDTVDETDVAFSVTWDMVYAESHPDTVSIAMNRVSSPLKYLYLTDPSGAFLEEDQTKEEATLQYAAYGDYVVLAYSYNKEDYTLWGEENFVDDEELSIKDFRATVKELPEGLVTEMTGGNKLDFNSSYRFIRMGEPFWCSYIRAEVSDTRENKYNMIMRPMLMELKIFVRLEAESGIRINSVIAELSGVPATFSLLSAEAHRDDIARVIFRMEAVEGGYMGTATFPGLFPSENISLCTGPGILRLAVSATKGDTDRLLRPAINLANAINAAGLMERIPGTETWRIAAEKARLDVPGTLKIAGDSFDYESGGSGVAGWFDSENVDVEI